MTTTTTLLVDSYEVRPTTDSRCILVHIEGYLFETSGVMVYQDRGNATDFFLAVERANEYVSLLPAHFKAPRIRVVFVPARR